MAVRLNENQEIVDLYVEYGATGALQVSNVIVSQPGGNKEGDQHRDGKEFRDQIADPDFEGYCHCMLYYKSKD